MSMNKVKNDEEEPAQGENMAGQDYKLQAFALRHGRHLHESRLLRFHGQQNDGIAHERRTLEAPTV